MSFPYFFFAGLNFWFFALFFFSFLVCHRLIVWKRTRKQTKFGKTTWKQRLKHANVIQFSVSVILLFFSLMFVITFYLCIIFIYWLICLAFFLLLIFFLVSIGWVRVCFLLAVTTPFWFLYFFCFVFALEISRKGLYKQSFIRKELESKIPYFVFAASKFWIDFRLF